MKITKIISYLVGIAFLIAMIEGVVSYILVWALVGVAFGILIVNLFGIKQIKLFKK